MPDTERREWLDEFEEAGWTKSVSPDGAISYERACEGGKERYEFDGGARRYSRPVAPVIVARMPTATTTLGERGLFWRLRRWWRGSDA